MSIKYDEYWRVRFGRSNNPSSMMWKFLVETESGLFVTETANEEFANHIVESHNEWLASEAAQPRIREVV